MHPGAIAGIVIGAVVVLGLIASRKSEFKVSNDQPMSGSYEDETRRREGGGKKRTGKRVQKNGTKKR